MTTSAVITAYERLNRILYEYGTNNRKDYDVTYHQEEYDRKMAEMSVKEQNEATKEFLLNNQESILTGIADMFRISVEHDKRQVEQFQIRASFAIVPGDYNGMDIGACNKYLVEMLVSLMESVCKVNLAIGSIEFCALKECNIIEYRFTADFTQS